MGYEASSWVEKTAIEMADAIIAVSEETKVDANNSEDKSEETKSEDKKSEESADIEYFKSELEKMKKVQDKLAQDRYHNDKRNKRDEEVEEEEEEEKPLTQAQLDEKLAEERDRTRKEILASEADRLASSQATSPEEKELVLAYFQTHRFPENMPISEQIENCIAMANRKKLIGERNEALRALKGKENTTVDGGSAHQEPLKKPQAKLDEKESKAYKSVGMSWNNEKSWWEKKMPNGKTLIRDKEGTRLV